MVSCFFLSFFPALKCDKCCAAGINEIDISTSLDLVKRTAVGLRNSTVDDTHLSRRWGDLLKGLASRLQSRLLQPTTSNGYTTGPPLLATLPANHAPPTDAPVASHQAQSLTSHSATQDRPQARADLEPNDFLDPDRSNSEDGRLDTQFDVWSMWWDNRFSQANINYMPWYPTLGLVDGSNPVFSSDAGGGSLDSASWIPGSLY